MKPPRLLSSDPTLEAREALRRKREVIAIFVIAVVLGLLFLLEAFFFDFRGAIGSANLLFFGLINVNIILACVLLFLIFRNLTKLVFERRRRVLGARLRTRLVVAFVAFALVPTVLMFYVAMTFITNSIERWFTLQIENSLNESLEVAQKFYESATSRAVDHAKDIAELLGKDERFAKWRDREPGPDAEKTEEDLLYSLEERRQLLRVESIELFAGAARAPVIARSTAIPKSQWPRPEKDVLEKAFSKKTASHVDRVGDGEIVRGFAPLVAPDGRVNAVVVVGFFVPESLLAKMKHIQQTYKEYKMNRLLELPIRASYFVILALISVFIFFSATWFGFYLARQITDPLQNLAEGARQVATGELDLRIPKVADDEIGTVVEAFNKMLDDLAASRLALETAYADLEATNIELERRRASMEAILVNVAAGVLSFDNAGRVITVNPSAERVLGIKAEEALTKTWADVFPPELSDAFRKLGEELTKGRKRTVQGQIDITVGGELRTVLAILSLLRGASGEAAGAVLVVDDLTELLSAQRVGAWQEIARRIAHEIKNPLTPIQLAAQRLRKRYGDRFEKEGDAVFSESTGVIIRQVDEMKRMVQEFSDFARMAEAKPVLTAVGEIVDEVVILYREAHRQIAFETEIDETLPLVLADRDQLKRALINIIDNAVEAIDAPGRIDVRARRLPEGKQVRLEVADTGRGIPRAYRGRLFEPYFSTKKMGTGLGLAIVHRIVTDHGGHIQLRDNKPHGTIVLIDLPVRTTEITAAE